MHFGKIVKRVALSHGLAAQDVAALLDRTEKDVLILYEQKEWTSGTIKAVSIALDYDFGKYLNTGFNYNFNETSDEYREFMITVKYPKGKEFLLKTWLDKLVLIARSIGLEVGK